MKSANFQSLVAHSIRSRMAAKAGAKPGKPAARTAAKRASKAAPQPQKGRGGAIPSRLVQALVSQMPQETPLSSMQPLAPQQQQTAPVANRADIISRALDLMQRRQAMQSLMGMSQG